MSPPYCLTLSRSCCSPWNHIITSWNRDCGVFYGWKCALGSVEWGFVTLSGRREAGRAHFNWPSSSFWKVRTIHGNCLAAVSLQVSCTQSQPSVLLAVLFPREMPEKDQLVGSPAVEGSFLGHLGSTGQGGWVVPSPWGYFQTASVMCLWGLRWHRWKETGFIVLVGQVQQITDLWQDCLGGFDSSVEVDALSVSVKVKQVPLASTNFLLSV